MSQRTLFIADLHLNDQDPETYQRFQYFLKNKARKARALYILGDMFEYYLGDDAISGVIQKVCHDLNTLVTDHQTQCFFMAGNRDFLLSTTFAETAKLTIINDPTTIELDNNKLIITHGDEMCTDDIEYQKIRQQLRSDQWQQQFLSLSIPDRIEFAKQARIKSQQHTQSASSKIMDVNQQAVTDLFSKYKTTLMIHGHTHRPAFHTVLVNNKQHQRMVVGDWHYQSSYIEYKNNDFQLITY